MQGQVTKFNRSLECIKTQVKDSVIGTSDFQQDLEKMATQPI